MQAKSEKVLNFAAYAGSVPPQNVEAEEAILGGILLDPGAISRVAEDLKPEAFYVLSHREIYKAAIALHGQGKPTDLMCVSTYLDDRGILERVGGLAKLAQLVGSTISAANIDRYADLVMDKYHRRQIIQVGNEIAELGNETALDLPSVVNEAQSKLMEATSYQQGEKWAAKPISDLLVDVFQEIEAGGQPGYKTGLLDLDGLTGGLFKQDLVVVAGRPGMGKTFFGCYLANHFAVHHQLPVVFFSAEMDCAKLTKRFVSMHSGIDLARLVQNRVAPNEWESLSNAVGTIAQLPLYINDTPASKLTPNMIRAELRRIQVETGSPIGLVVLDYLQKLGDRAASNRAQVVGAFAGEAKDIAKEFNCPFVALAQINREVESTKDNRPSIANLKDSGDIEQDADEIFLLYRDEYYRPATPDRNILEINAAKNRNGPVGLCKVIFKPEIGFYGSIQKRGFGND
jgi:replicative DNA helicase